MKNPLKTLSEPTTETIPLYYPGAVGRSSVRVPYGLRAKIDELLSFIYTSTGAKFSRNEFIVKSVQFYLSHLLKSRSKKELVRQIEEIS